MNIEQYINNKKQHKKILIMTHQVLGFPNFETNEQAIQCFEENEVDMVELQIPFSDPSADGPTFIKANQEALDNGVTVSKCLEFAASMTKKHNIPFLIMTYFNILYQYGIEKFIQKCKTINISGLIVPDAPIDEASEYFECCKKHGISAITLATPYCDSNRLKTIVEAGSGFVYYVPRKGVTGSKTNFDQEVINGIKKTKELSSQNIGVGFGIQTPKDVEALIGSSDIAIIGSKISRIIEDDGISGLYDFMKEINKVTKE